MVQYLTPATRTGKAFLGMGSSIGAYLDAGSQWTYRGSSLAVQWLGLGSLTVWVQGLIPGWGTKIVQAIPHSPKQNNRYTEISWFGFGGGGSYSHEEG